MVMEDAWLASVVWQGESMMIWVLYFLSESSVTVMCSTLEAWSPSVVIDVLGLQQALLGSRRIFEQLRQLPWHRHVLFQWVFPWAIAICLLCFPWLLSVSSDVCCTWPDIKNVDGWLVTTFRNLVEEPNPQEWVVVCLKNFRRADWDKYSPCH